MSCVKVNAMSYALLIKSLMDGDLTMFELAAETGLHYDTVRSYCKELHKAKAIHIERFEPDARGRHTIKVYKIGAVRDAKRPRMSGAERQSRRRAVVRSLNDRRRMFAISSVAEAT